MRADPFSIHHWSIWCGLTALHHLGSIELSYTTKPAPAGSGLWLDVEDRDTREQKTIWVDISDRAPADAERRRAADSSWVRNASEPVGRPLGFVAPMRSGFESSRRYLASATIAAVRSLRPNDFRRSISALALTPFALPLSEFESRPGGAPRILFQTGAWDPQLGSDPTDRHQINMARATLIRRLRAEYGERFTGGFRADPYAVETYPDLLATGPTDRLEYLHLMKQNAIVVSSTGLHGSIPWKLAEYLAASRAIVSEPIANRVPCSLTGVIEFFSSPDDCIETIEALLADSSMCEARQQAAGALWRKEVRPDRLLLARLGEEFDH